MSASLSNWDKLRCDASLETTSKSEELISLSKLIDNHMWSKYQSSGTLIASSYLNTYSLVSHIIDVA